MIAAVVAGTIVASALVLRSVARHMAEHPELYGRQD
jgi:hypothetical protein